MESQTVYNRTGFTELLVQVLQDNYRQTRNEMNVFSGYATASLGVYTAVAGIIFTYSSQEILILFTLPILNLTYAYMLFLWFQNIKYVEFQLLLLEKQIDYLLGVNLNRYAWLRRYAFFIRKTEVNFYRTASMGVIGLNIAAGIIMAFSKDTLNAFCRTQINLESPEPCGIFLSVNYSVCILVLFIILGFILFYLMYLGDEAAQKNDTLIKEILDGYFSDWKNSIIGKGLQELALIPHFGGNSYFGSRVIAAVRSQAGGLDRDDDALRKRFFAYLKKEFK
jgi:hypothetical protein